MSEQAYRLKRPTLAIAIEDGKLTRPGAWRLSILREARTPYSPYSRYTPSSDTEMGRTIVMPDICKIRLLGVTHAPYRVAGIVGDEQGSCGVLHDSDGSAVSASARWIGKKSGEDGAFLRGDQVEPSTDQTSVQPHIAPVD